MMGFSSKLIGLAGLNIFLALTMSVAYLSHYASGRLQILTQENVTAFIHDVSDITAGKRKDMDQYAITTYFMDHVADDGKFRSTVRTSIPGMEDKNAVTDKKAFIADVLQDMRQKGKHEASVKVEDIKISDNGHTATAITTSSEHGTMQINAQDGGTPGVAPVSATSYCQQTMSLGNNHMIQIVGATCTTDIALSDSF